MKNKAGQVLLKDWIACHSCLSKKFFKELEKAARETERLFQKDLKELLGNGRTDR